MKLFISVLAAAAFFIIGIATPAFADDKSLSSAVESALLRGDWATLHKTLGDLTADKMTPSERFAWAHACLACNDCNRALAVFISATDAQTHFWRDYTVSLARSHSDNAVAQYLKGDAEARCGDLVSARKSFDRAISKNHKLALAWNARGACSVLLGDMDDAVVDLTTATKVDPNLAEPHMSLGAYWILTRVPDAARDEFRAAIAKHDELALAWNGLGCAEFGSGNMDSAYTDFANAVHMSPALAIAWANQGFVLASVAAQSDKQPSPGSKPGTSLTFTSEPTQPESLTPERVAKLASSAGISAALQELNARESQLGAEARYLNGLSQHEVSAVSVANVTIIGLTAGRELLRAVDTALVGVKAGTPIASLESAYEQAWWGLYSRSFQDIAPAKAKLGVGLAFAATDPHDLSFSLSGLLKQSLLVPAMVSREAAGARHQDLTFRVANLNAEVQRIEAEKHVLTSAAVPPQAPTLHNAAPTITLDKPQPRNPLPPDNIRPKPPVASNPPVFPPDDRQPSGIHDTRPPGQPPSGSLATLPWSYTKPVALPRANGVITSVAGANVDNGEWPVITFFTLAYKPPIATAKDQ